MRIHQWLRNKIFISTIIIVVIILMFVAVNTLNRPKTAEYITFKQLGDDYNDNTKNFASYDVGDTVLIKDTIYRIRLDVSGNDTDIAFESLGKTESGMPSVWLIVPGDLTKEYHPGDKVIVSVHIVAGDDGEEIYFDVNDIRLA